MRAWLIILALLIFCVSSHAKSWPSPDGRFAVESTEGADHSCTIVLRQLQPASAVRVLFTRHTFVRYVLARWSPHGARCVLLDAPDNANTNLWVFWVRGNRVFTTELDYGDISETIEHVRLETRRSDEHSLTRSGVDSLHWHSDSRLTLDITYNNVPVAVLADFSAPGLPRYRVSSAVDHR